MTRYARAEGSKACNKREAEDATPWKVMVAGLKRSGPQADRRKNVEDSKKRFSNPEEFDEQDDQMLRSVSDSDEEVTAPVMKEEPIEEVPLKHTPAQVKLEAAPETSEEPSKKKKNSRRKDKCLVCKQIGHQKKECPELPEERRKELQELYIMKIERKGKGTGRKKNKKRSASETLTLNETEHSTSEPPAKKSKKPLTDKAGQIVGEGEALFQGFRVKIEDMKRLRKLQKKLKKNKVPGEEINRVLKQERRKAEKELANTKKRVCFNCRQPGHMLADCPASAESSEAKMTTSVHEVMAGVCFKCGSAEHTSKDCKSKKKGEQAYEFATCFICKQSGHLAKSCPDNPRGLYPKGGGCRFCGSVEHLKSNCPRKFEKDSRKEIRVGRQDAEMPLEDVSEAWANQNEVSQGKKKKSKADDKNSSKKVVMF